jgi:hypothetical protein
MRVTKNNLNKIRQEKIMFEIGLGIAVAVSAGLGLGI